jgi:hypothetical protein
MRKTQKLLLIIITATFLSSCVVKKSGKYHEKIIENTGVHTDLIHADMVIDEKNKITGNASATYFLFFRISGDNHYAEVNTSGFFGNFASLKKGPKQAAQYKALKSANVDFIVKPSYTFKRTSFLGLITIIEADVSGYGGVYKNFEQVDIFERIVDIEVNKKLVEGMNLNKEIE